MDINDKYKYSLKSVKFMLVVVVLLAALTTYMDIQGEKQELKQAQIEELAQQLNEQTKQKQEQKAQQEKEVQNAQASEYQQNQDNSEQISQNETSQYNDSDYIQNLRQEAALEAQNGNTQRAINLYSDVYKNTQSKDDVIVLAELLVSVNEKGPLEDLIRVHITYNPQDEEDLAKYLNLTSY